MRRVLVGLCLVGCEGLVRDPVVDTPIEDVTIDAFGPSVLVPGSTIAISGTGFLPDFAGPTTLVLAGDGLELRLPVAFVDYTHVQALWPGESGGDGPFTGTATIEIEPIADGELHVSAPKDVSFSRVALLEPVLDTVDDAGRQVNDAIGIGGSGLLLGGDEGQTSAVIEGCFTRTGTATCRRVPTREIPVSPIDPLDRTAATFPFLPEIAGIEPGRFEGELRLVNRHASGVETESEAVALEHRIEPPVLSGFTPERASLGQIVAVSGGGFVGPDASDPSATTLLELDGRFSAPGVPGFDIVLTLVGGFVQGERLDYVINESDALGRLADVRSSRGRFVGTARPIVAWGDAEVQGEAVPVSLALAPVKQVVWLKVLPSFVEGLRPFGLHAARDRVIARIVAVVERDYDGVNLDVRLEAPTDFALYSVVELGGPDPNGLGLLGYDNTPGKDTGNERLYDTIGGVNALTQQDGYPGYGGVFVDSLFSYSAHPPGGAVGGDLAEDTFDRLFDPVRPDVAGGVPITSGEADDLPAADDLDCPGEGRTDRIACAVFALGNLVGTTTSHEIAHSLGLADPEGLLFHHAGDWNDALMDAGSSRPFAERAEVGGEGPGRFCRIEFEYLQLVLPTDAPDPLPDRQDCY